MVIFKSQFKDELKHIYGYIKQDSKDRANNFISELIKKLENIENNPFMYRKSLYFDDDSKRDFIFKGYTIPYEIVDEKIYILGIFKANEWECETNKD